ncbi:hypothetical protein OG596_26410 [Streptomyces sp. NBC_01102]|uniref:hypothetical protein n=1 Tax=Streptomyces sp. NBC_01102 TaxID=2903749 RepID=UPI003865C98D|nr:hypothetical protein OG596_26410 [Streptomyces sp. NBC_01102]
MSEQPITPTRIIPAGTPMPTPLPDRGPRPGEEPPWRRLPPLHDSPLPPSAPPPAAAPPPDPAPQLLVLMPYVPEPDPTRRERLWAWVRTIGRPWQVCGALVLALVPIPGTGYSVATTWAYAVSQARAAEGQDLGYALALTPLAIAVIRITRGGGTLLRLLLLAVSLIGLTGAISLYDPVTWITGVRP